MFNIFVIELPRVFRPRYLFFEDDLNLRKKINTLKDVQLLQQELAAPYAFSIENALPINVGICLVMSIGRKAPVAIYTIGSTPLTVMDKVNDLGVLMQEYLSTSRQCLKMTATSLRKPWMILRLFIKLTI